MTDIQYATRGVVSRDTIARALPDALAVVAEWPGCYQLVVSDGPVTRYRPVSDELYAEIVQAGQAVES